MIADRTAEALEDFWCSDCTSGELFERVSESATGSEWLCTACGAGYFDALDRVIGVDASRRPLMPANVI